MAFEPSLRELSRSALTLVLAGGRGSRLGALTDRRAKPAVHFGGKLRIIDFALSNALNSGFRQIAVLTQYKSHSLLRHLQRGWSFLRGEMGEFVDLLPAQQRVNEESWYLGTADAVYQNLDIFLSLRPSHVIILAGDHVYKMDYGKMLWSHVVRGAEATVACIEVPRMEATGFGVMHIDDQERVLKFVEKPKDPPAMPGRPDTALASMGVYVFNGNFLFDQLRRDAEDRGSSHDFGKDIIPHLVNRGSAVYAHRFPESCVKSESEAPTYWRDVGTIDAYWEANIDLTSVVPPLDLYDPKWRIWTSQEQLPPAKFVHDEETRRGYAVNSMISAGCILSGAEVRRSLLSSNVRCNSFSRLSEAVVLPDVVVQRGARLSKVVIDRGVIIPEGLIVGEDPAEDARRFSRTDNGVTLITQDMLRRL
jgi:glucose-1-phosphate adenylyltransferase